MGIPEENSFHDVRIGFLIAKPEQSPRERNICNVYNILGFREYAGTYSPS
jgi:hypothetical protein